MKLYVLAAIAVLMLAGCPNGTTITPDTPPPSPNPDVKADCALACANIGPVADGLECEEGEPTADGASCTEVCEGMPNTTQDYLDCVATVTSCDQVSKCPH